ncbi:MAG: hypothetical protein DMG06_24160 [Acidobacteria bacterium]|nr:MAG: hypothetical protein DMG06_24160 [Acidobacteriota bacterium]
MKIAENRAPTAREGSTGRLRQPLPNGRGSVQLFHAPCGRAWREATGEGQPRFSVPQMFNLPLIRRIMRNSLPACGQKLDYIPEPELLKGLKHSGVP